ncbi:hypothetical protein TKK_0010538 [Trichogramma kaykai]|uniref:acid phosphatase n=1 Tax=Trichogramma kaykai TaxID=54128 RepID=A0ABD2WVI6_9HYME
MKILVIKFLLASCSITFARADNDDGYRLKHVSVIFRHGDRAPDPVEMFPNDPNYQNTFYPYGLGGLTNEGKRREYRLGEMLRERYDELLGELYQADAIYARSTDYRRAKMCLQLVLAALYPPKGPQIWRDELAWQPIPAEYAPSIKDWLMIPEECPEYLKEHKDVKSLPEVKEKIDKLSEFMSNLTEWTGREISYVNDMYNLYHILVAEQAMGLELPRWAKEVFPKGQLYDGIQLWYEIFSKTTHMRRTNGGKLLHNVLSHMSDLERGQRAPKLGLYSGHETNVAAILQTLGLWYPHVPEYSSAVVLELHEKDSQYYVKVLYYLGIPEKWVEQVVPGCEAAMCPADKFRELLAEVTPSKDEMACDKSVAKGHGYIF